MAELPIEFMKVEHHRLSSQKGIASTSVLQLCHSDSRQEGGLDEVIDDFVSENGLTHVVLKEEPYLPVHLITTTPEEALVYLANTHGREDTFVLQAQKQLDHSFDQAAVDVTDGTLVDDGVERQWPSELFAAFTAHLGRQDGIEVTDVLAALDQERSDLSMSDVHRALIGTHGYSATEIDGNRPAVSPSSGGPKGR